MQHLHVCTFNEHFASCSLIVATAATTAQLKSLSGPLSFPLYQSDLPSLLAAIIICPYRCCVHFLSTFIPLSLKYTGWPPKNGTTFVCLITLSPCTEASAVGTRPSVLYRVVVHYVQSLVSKFNIQSLSRPKHELKLHIWNSFVSETVCRGH